MMFAGGGTSPLAFDHSFTLREPKHRKLCFIAAEIHRDWGDKVNYAAKPYLEAMYALSHINEHFYSDSARSVVLYFLSNAATWRGKKASAIKAELKAILNLPT